MADSDCNGGREEIEQIAMNIAVVDQVVIESSVKEENMSLVLANQVIVEPSMEEENKSLVAFVASQQEIVESSMEKENKSLVLAKRRRCKNNDATTTIAPDASMQRNNNPTRQPGDELINDHVAVVHADSINWGKLLFEKKLTPSDAGDYNRMAVPRKCAKQHFPPLDSTNPKYQPTITFYDIHNNKFKMKYESWPGCQMNALTRGWKNFLKFHDIHASDTVSFYASVDHHLHLARADATNYVYGIHHYREPVLRTRTLRFFGHYYIISEKTPNPVNNQVAANHGGGAIIANGEHAAMFRPNGGRKRIRKAADPRTNYSEQIAENNQQLVLQSYSYKDEQQ